MSIPRNSSNPERPHQEQALYPRTSPAPSSWPSLTLGQVSCIRCRTADDMGRKSDVSAGQGLPSHLCSGSYGRLSWSPTTHELEKIETQWASNRVTINRHAGVMGRELSDGLSAWKKDVRRTIFELLSERAAAGLSHGIAVWHVDRLFRQPREAAGRWAAWFGLPAQRSDLGSGCRQGRGRSAERPECAAQAAA